MRTPALTLLVIGTLALAGCSGGEASAPSSPSASPSSSTSLAPEPPADPASPAPQASGAASPAAPQGPPAPRRLVDAGISVEVPSGWSAASMDPASRQAAVAGQPDQKDAAFLKSQLDRMAATGGVMYLYDLSRVDQGVLSAVEVYRYPETDPQAVADQKIAPAMKEAGLAPVVGTTDLPAGKAVTVVGRADTQGVALTSAVALLTLGPSVVSLNSTFGEPTAAQVQKVVASVQAA